MCWAMSIKQFYSLPSKIPKQPQMQVWWNTYAELWVYRVIEHSSIYLFVLQILALTGRNLSLSNEVILSALPSVDGHVFLHERTVGRLLTSSIEAEHWSHQLYSLLFCRLTVPLAMVIAFSAGIEYLLGSGPFWAQVIGITTGYFEGYWWTKLLYQNNFLYESCVGQTWYLACDK